MSTPSTNAALPKPIGTDTVSRANHNALIDAIDAVFAIKATLVSDYVKAGKTNADVVLIKSLLQAIDTRIKVPFYDSSGRISRIDEMDGQTVVKSTTSTYDAQGRLSSIIESVGGVNYTTTVTYKVDGSIDKITPS